MAKIRIGMLPALKGAVGALKKPAPAAPAAPAPGGKKGMPVYTKKTVLR